MTELSIDQALHQGMAAHKAGQAQEAERFYSAILKAQPNHPDANHNIGVLFVGLGKAQEALSFFMKAVETHPATEQFWISYIDTLIKLDEIARARTVLDQAKSMCTSGDEFGKFERRLIEANKNRLKNNITVMAERQQTPSILDTLKLDQALKLAKKKAKNGFIYEAQRIYQDILTKFPKNKGAIHGLRALEVGKTFQVQDPPQFHLEALINLYNQGQLEQVQNQAVALVQQFPNSAILLGIHGAALKDLLRLDESIEVYKRALAIKPDYTDAYYNMGAAFQNQGNLEEAVEAYNKALNIKPDYVEAHYNKGIALKDQGKLVEAIASFNTALSIKPDYAYAYNNIGNAFKDQGNLAEAMEAYTKATVIKPDYARAHFNIGNIFQVQGKLDDAIKAYNQVLAIDPGCAEAFNNMGNVLQGQGKLDDAINVYKKALAIDPDYAAAHNNTGVALKVQGKLEEAIEAYNKALAIKPNYAEAYNDIGTILKDQGKLEEAIEAYRKALTIEPDQANATLNLAIILYETSQYVEAAVFFKKNTSNQSQNYLLKCFYEQDKQTSFYDHLNHLINLGENNAIIGSYISRSEIRYGIATNNPFCNDPLQYVLKIDLTKRYDFKNTFVKRAMNILEGDDLQSKRQPLITKGIQTSGNVFSQLDSNRDQIQNIVRQEIENFRLKFRSSTEGLIKNWPAQYKLNGWIVRMKDGGAIKPHMHEEGWLSGSIYINVPPKLNKDSGNLVVCLSDELSADNNMISLDVITGSLCLFPSSLLHYTVPFESDDDRIVIAFDMIPNS
ncbi:tetratricopeptide repeat protein [Planktomarina temperata]|nr:tetratricopeptide repeat protein [Planktomarina temperata]